MTLVRDGSITPCLFLFKSFNELLDPHAEEFSNCQIAMERVGFLYVLHLGQSRQGAPDLSRPHIDQLSRLGGSRPAVTMRRKCRFTGTLCHVRVVRFLVSKLRVAIRCGEQPFLSDPWL